MGASGHVIEGKAPDIVGSNVAPGRAIAERRQHCLRTYFLCMFCMFFHVQNVPLTPVGRTARHGVTRPFATFMLARWWQVGALIDSASEFWLSCYSDIPCRCTRQASAAATPPSSAHFSALPMCRLSCV